MAREPTVPDPRHYMVERFWPGIDREQLAAAQHRLRAAVSELAGGGTDIRLLTTTFIPADEVVLTLFEATDVNDVVEANRRSEVPFDRVQAVEVSPVPRTGGGGR